MRFLRHRKSPSSPILDVLVKARSIIESPSTWNKGNLHRKAYPGSGRPDTYCLVGAINLAITGNANDHDGELRKQALEALGFQSRYGAELWNDGALRSHSDVINRINAVIERLSA